MAKSAAKPGSIPSYEEELEKLSAELKATEEERAHLEAQWREKYMPDVEELIEFARRRKHPWAQKIAPDNEGIVKETFLELPSIGWQLFILESSQSDSTAFPSCLDT